MKLKIRKVLRIASYDFRRLMLNPITLCVFAVVMVACMIVGAVYKVPVAPQFSANTYGTTTQQIFDNFNSPSLSVPEDVAQTLDTRQALDTILQANILTAQRESDDMNTFKAVNEKFQQFLPVVDAFDLRFSANPSYQPTDTDISPFLQAANSLNEFVEKFKNLQQFESRVFFTNAQFSQLESINSFFLSVAKTAGTFSSSFPSSPSSSSSSSSTQLSPSPAQFSPYSTQSSQSQTQLPTATKALILKKLVAGRENFVSLNSLAATPMIATWLVSGEQLDELEQTYYIRAQQKASKIYAEMSRLNALATPTDKSYAAKMQSLITNYKLTAQSAQAGAVAQLKLLLMSKFSHIENFYGYTADAEENLKVQIAKINFLLADEGLYYSAHMQPLNFNTASTQVTIYDNTYFVISLIGFATVIFGIFCAYKLFGRDRKLGKMDIVLSQNVTFGQVFTAKTLAIIFATSAILGVFTLFMFIWSMLFCAPAFGSILAVFNLSNAYTIHPLLFLLVKVASIELQVIFYSVITVFLMNISRKFELFFCIALLIFAAATVCNIFFCGSLAYCLLPFIHADLSTMLGGGKIGATFLQTVLYSHGNFFISLAYYLVVVSLLFNFTKQLFKKN